MAETAAKMIDLIVFEDGVSMYGPEISASVPIPHTEQLYGSPEVVDWHLKWNALGDYAEDLRRHCVRLDNEAAFEEALDWSLTANIRAVVICDYNFINLRITQEQVERVGAAALAVTEAGTVAAATDYFNREAHGLLLVAALAANPNVDVDVWLATGIHVDQEENRRRLAPFLRARFSVEVARNNLTRAAAPAPAIDLIKRAVNQYFVRRQQTDPGFWPTYANTWFESDDAPVPHRHGDFLKIQAASQKGGPSLVGYLATLGASAAVTACWLSEHGCYETLKHFVGACALVHASEDRSRGPFLGSLVLVLLHATGGGEWAEGFDWSLARFRPIIKGDRREGRKLLLACHQLFHSLYKAQNGISTNAVRAQFQSKSDGVHLNIDFQFDCAVGEAVEKPSFLAKILAPAQGSPSGDSTKAFAAVRDSVLADSGERNLFLAVYPVPEGRLVWTRLDFKANS